MGRVWEMGNDGLPAGWAWAELGDVVQPVRRQITPAEQPTSYFNYLSIENIESGSGQLIAFKPTMGRDIRSAKYLFTPKDVLYSKLRPYLNKVHLPKFDGISATDLVPLRPADGISREYIAYYLRSRKVVEYARERMRGIQLPRLPVADLLALKIPIPPSKEQDRITTRIHEFFQELRATKQTLLEVPLLIRQLRQSTLSNAFRGELTEREPADGSAQELLKGLHSAKLSEPGNLPASKTDDTFDIPTNWVWSSLGDVTEIEMGQSPPGSYYNKERRGVPLLNGPTEFGPEHPTPTQWTTKPTRICRSGDLLICVRGNTTGRMNLADQPYCIGRGLAAIRPLDGIVHAGLVKAFLEFKANEIMAQTSGSTFPNLSGGKLRGLYFPLAPFKEQGRIIAKIDKITSVIGYVSSSLTKVEELIRELESTILTKAFRGELVPQDSNDEPATDLLNRLKAAA
jgi:type I restriction enzyme, S subunit